MSAMHREQAGVCEYTGNRAIQLRQMHQKDLTGGEALTAALLLPQRHVRRIPETPIEASFNRKAVHVAAQGRIVMNDVYGAFAGEGQHCRGHQVLHSIRGHALLSHFDV
jgi:hypothetical protein